jgi:hypothetical protein
MNQDKELAYLNNNIEQIKFYSFADKLNRYEIKTLLAVKGNKYWQFKYLISKLKEKSYAGFNRSFY